MDNQNDSETASASLREVLADLASAFGSALAGEFRRWLLWGAVLGAIVVGGAGLYFFGLEGLGIGLLAGAAIGGIGALLLYLWASSV